MSYISYSRGKFIATDEVNLGILSNFLSVIRGFQVFTFLKTINRGKPIFLELHVDRVIKNAKLMGLKIDISNDELIALVKETLSKNDFSKSESNIMIVFAGTSPTDDAGLRTDKKADIFIVISKAKEYSKESYEKGVSLGLFEYQRMDAKIKSPYTYYGGLKAQNIDDLSSFDEVIYHNNGNILEGTTFSFFGVKKDGTIITSKADGKILESITRKVIIDIMKKNDIKHNIDDIPLEMIDEFNEAFIASSNRDIIPVKSINGKLLNNGIIGENCRNIIKVYKAEINAKN